MLKNSDRQSSIDMVKRDSSIVKLGLVQMSMVKDQPSNLKKAQKMIAQASELGANIVCLPELFNSLYFPQEEKAKPFAENIPGSTSESLSKIARENKVVLVAGSLYEKSKNGFYNTSVIFDENGNLIDKYRKVHIPQDPSFYEQNYFSSGSEYKVFKTRYGKIGVLICFDQWYPEAARINKLMGAEMIFYPTAIGWVKGIEPVEGDWHEAWEKVQVGHAISNSVIVAAVNRVGVENDMRFWGGSFVCDQFGKVVLRADDKEGVYLATVNLKLGKEVEEGWGFLRNRRPATYDRLLK